MPRLQQTALILSREHLADLMQQLLICAETMDDKDNIILTFATTKLSHEVFKNSDIFYKIMTAMVSCAVVPDGSHIMQPFYKSYTFPKFPETETYAGTCQNELATYFRKNTNNYAEVRLFGENG